MAETPQNIFHDALDEPYKGFVQLVERLSVFSEEPSVYIVDDDSPYLPIKGLQVSWGLSEEGQVRQHRLSVEIGAGSRLATARFIHDQQILPRMWYMNDWLTEALAEIEDGDLFGDEDFFGQTVKHIRDLAATSKLRLQND